jgi:hypothetical protein
MVPWQCVTPLKSLVLCYGVKRQELENHAVKTHEENELQVRLYQLLTSELMLSSQLHVSPLLYPRKDTLLNSPLLKNKETALKESSLFQNSSN